MKKQNYRVAVVGAASLLGREIAEELASGLMAAADVVLLDDEAEMGKLEEVGGEVTFLQKIEPAAFEDADVAIFATRETAEKHWKTALQLGAAVVDATGVLTGVPVRLPQAGEMTGAPGSSAFAPLDLSTSVVTIAHPVAAMLALMLHRIARRAGVTAAFATVLQPASENGAVALDELHQQTVNLLSFQDVPKDQFDVQAAFNLLSRFGEDAKAQIASTAERVQAQLQSLLPDTKRPVTQWLQAPVFHGFGASLMVTLEQPVSTSDMAAAIRGELITVIEGEDEPPSNVSAAGNGSVLVQVRSEPANASESDTFVFWLVADNLKLAAQTAVASAVELTRLRPLGAVQ